MADETTPETPAAPVAAPFDSDALSGQIVERLKAEFNTRQDPLPAPAPPIQNQPADPVREMLNPYLEPVRRQAALAGESATDAAEFYSEHNDLDKTDRKEIEIRFKALSAQGHAFKREDILNHYRGENIDKEVDKRIAARNAAAARAQDAASVVGAGSPDRGQTQVLNAREMTTEALAKAIEGQSF